MVLQAILVALQVTAGAVPDAGMRRCLGEGDWSTRDEVEPHVAVSPVDGRHVVAAWMVRMPGSVGAIQAAVSRDGGRTWGAPVTLPFSACAGGPAELPYTSDPWVTIGGDGRVYASAIGFTQDDRESALLVTTSADGGATWSAPSVVSSRRTAGVMHDNTAVSASAEVPGLAYVTATRYGPESGPAALARTEDGGRTWTALRPIPLPADVANPIGMAPQPSAGRGRDVRVVHSTPPRGSRVVLVHSRDGGETWEPPVPVAAWTWQAPPASPLPGRGVGVAPDIVHAAGAYVAHPATDSAGRYVVALAYHHGSRWQGRQLNPAGTTAWRPTLALTADSVAAVTYFQPGAALDSASFEASVELAWVRGTEVIAHTTIDRFTWRARRNGEFFLGDYHGLVISDRAALAVYARSTEQGVRVHAVRTDVPQ